MIATHVWHKPLSTRVYYGSRAEIREMKLHRYVACSSYLTESIRHVTCAPFALCTRRGNDKHEMFTRSNVDLMQGQYLRRWPSIKPTLSQRLVLARYWLLIKSASVQYVCNCRDDLIHYSCYGSRHFFLCTQLGQSMETK